MDFLGELVKLYIIVYLVTIFVKIYSCKRISVNAIKFYLQNYFSELVKPALIITDNATSFHNIDRFKRFCKKNSMILNVLLSYKRNKTNIVPLKKLSTRVIYLVPRLNTRYNITFIQVCAPISNHTDEEVAIFCASLDNQLRHNTLLSVDFDA